MNKPTQHEPDIVHLMNTPLAIAVTHGLALYVQCKIRKLGEKYLREKGSRLLLYACDPASSCILPEIVQTLVEYGADPSKSFMDSAHGNGA